MPWERTPASRAANGRVRVLELASTPMADQAADAPMAPAVVAAVALVPGVAEAGATAGPGKDAPVARSTENREGSPVAAGSPAAAGYGRAAAGSPGLFRLFPPAAVVHQASPGDKQ